MGLHITSALSMLRPGNKCGRCSGVENGGAEPQRRALCLQLLASIAACSPIGPGVAAAQNAEPLGLTLRRVIPSTGETVPAIGMGSWLTFDVARNDRVWNQRAAVLKTFFDLGGYLIDSSPMYGYAERVLGHCLEQTGTQKSVFAASKIWTPVAALGRGQMSNSESLWGVKPMDLMFVHNMVGWRKHLPQLRQWKQSGRVRYIGVSTSHGRRHDLLEQLLRTEALDFIQLTLNIEQTETEERLLPLAADKGVAVVVNRPFQRGGLFNRYRSRALPAIAKELGCNSWAAFFLLYVVSHPAVTCAIPATSQVAHMRENMATLQLTLPDHALRKQMRLALG